MSLRGFVQFFLTQFTQNRFFCATCGKPEVKQNCLSKLPKIDILSITYNKIINIQYDYKLLSFGYFQRLIN